MRVDPRTLRVTGEVRVDTATDPGSYCQGIVAVRGTLWACAARDGTTDLRRSTR